jgi:hypothetical protein
MIGYLLLTNGEASLALKGLLAMMRATAEKVRVLACEIPDREAKLWGPGASLTDWSRGGEGSGITPRKRRELHQSCQPELQSRCETPALDAISMTAIIGGERAFCPPQPSDRSRGKCEGRASLRTLEPAASLLKTMEEAIVKAGIGCRESVSVAEPKGSSGGSDLPFATSPRSTTRAQLPAQASCSCSWGERRRKE